MRTECPRCATTIFLTELPVGKKAECPFCRHLFLPVVLERNIPGKRIVPAVDPPADRFPVTTDMEAVESPARTLDDSAIVSPRTLSFGLFIVTASWILFFASSFLVVAGFLVQFILHQQKKNSPELMAFVAIQMMLGMLWGLTYLWGQWRCLKGLRKGSDARKSLTHALRYGSAATVMRTMAIAFPPIHLLAAWSASRSFTTFLKFLSQLSSALHRSDIEAAAVKLVRLYHRILILIFFGIFITAVIRPGAQIVVGAIGSGLGCFLLTMTFVAVRQAIILVRLTAEIRRVVRGAGTLDGQAHAVSTPVTDLKIPV